jgi:hypothetical protein
MTGMIFMALGLIIFFTGAVVYNKAGKDEKIENNMNHLNHIVETAAEDGVISNRERNRIERVAKELGLNPKVYLERAQKLVAESENEKETEIIDYHKKQGDDFEGFVAKKFVKKYFTLKNWAGDKYHEGVYGETTLHPDLLMEFKLGKHRELFSVECKWRSEFKDSQVQVAEDYQLTRYKKFAKENKQPVFLALGIGGKGIKPKELYMIPIEDFNSNIVS